MFAFRNRQLDKTPAFADPYWAAAAKAWFTQKLDDEGRKVRLGLEYAFASGEVVANGTPYKIRHLYGIRPHADRKSMAELQRTHAHPELITAVREDIELVQAAGTEFDAEKFLAGKQSPVYFGSALRIGRQHPHRDQARVAFLGDGEAVACALGRQGRLFLVGRLVGPNPSDGRFFLSQNRQRAADLSAEVCRR